MPCFDARVEGTLELWSQAPAEPLTETDWQAIMATTPADVDPESWAVPPGWRFMAQADD